MGKNFIDEYSLLHFAVGIVAYFFGIKLIHFNILHILFEFVENTDVGITVINTYFKDIWPGGKPRADAIINSVGDVIFGFLGWLFAYVVDCYGKKNNLYGYNI